MYLGLLDLNLIWFYIMWQNGWLSFPPFVYSSAEIESHFSQDAFPPSDSILLISINNDVGIIIIIIIEALYHLSGIGGKNCIY